jgi:Acyl-CoA dehydrogenase, C-terminal domain
MAKLVAGEMAFRAADRAMQLFGGAGYSKDLPIERIWRDVRVIRILDGTSEILRTIVGERDDGNPRAGPSRAHLGSGFPGARRTMTGSTSFPQARVPDGRPGSACRAAIGRRHDRARDGAGLLRLRLTLVLSQYRAY